MVTFGRAQSLSHHCNLAPAVFPRLLDHITRKVYAPRSSLASSITRTLPGALGSRKLTASLIAIAISVTFFGMGFVLYEYEFSLHHISLHGKVWRSERLQPHRES